MKYIVKMRENLYCFFYKNGSIRSCGLKNGVWSDTKTLIDDVHGSFSANLVLGEVLFFYQDAKGSLFKGKFAEGDIVIEEIMTGNDIPNRYYAVPTKDSLSLIYGIPSLGDGGYALVTQFVGTNGAWGALRRVDSIYHTSEEPFKLVSVSDRHFLVFYQGGGFENRLGYREIYDGEVGGFNLFHSGVNRFGDSSFLATKHELHGLYVVSSMFGARLMYRKKDANGFSPPIVVAEGQGIHNVLLYMVDEKLHLAFSRGGSLHQMAFEEKDGKQGFLPLDIQKEVKDDRIVKAKFLFDDSGNDRLLANELLVNEEKPWDIKIASNYVISHQKQRSDAKNLYAVALSEEDYNSFFDGMADEFLN